MATILRCAYTSMASPTFRESDIPALLEKSRANNSRAGLTGMLLYMEGTFFQVLEGDAATVDSLYDTISRDPRHSRVTRIIREPVARRDFADWTMGFQTLGMPELEDLFGANDFFANRSCIDQLNAGRARKLLTAFANGRWTAAATGMHRAHARLG
ncbi:MAG: BLUF domain-containing protein [Steroidobacteraceae bacterium]